MSRLQPVDPASMTPDQRKVYDSIASGPRGGVRGPFLALLHHPELADRVQHLGELLRYGTSFDRRLSELAIIVTARCLRCQYEWFAHAKLAAEAGVSAGVIEAIRTGKTPAFADEKERLVHDYIRELVGSHRVTDKTYAAVTQTFGARGAIELAGIAGYYSMIAATLNGHEINPPGEQPFAD